MSGTGFRVFDSTVQKTNVVLRAIEEAYGWPADRRIQSYTALRAVLHALRDRLPVEESADVAARLPMLLRGLYYDGCLERHVTEGEWRDVRAALPAELASLFG